MYRMLGVSLWMPLLALAAYGQTEPPATVESTGTATIEMAPDYFEFWITRRDSGDLLTEAVAKALPFRDELDAALEARNLDPASVRVSGIGIPSVTRKNSVVSARVRFDLSRFGKRDEKAIGFAAICDKVKAAGSALKASVDGPFLGIEDTESAEQQAVARATENALYRADAIVALMDSQIYAVQSVTVLEVQWNPGGERVPTLPDIDRITCVGRVKVVYKFGPL